MRLAAEKRQESGSLRRLKHSLAQSGLARKVMSSEDARQDQCCCHLSHFHVIAVELPPTTIGESGGASGRRPYAQFETDTYPSFRRFCSGGGVSHGSKRQPRHHLPAVHFNACWPIRFGMSSEPSTNRLRGCVIGKGNIRLYEDERHQQSRSNRVKEVTARNEVPTFLHVPIRASIRGSRDRTQPWSGQLDEPILELNSNVMRTEQSNKRTAAISPLGSQFSKIAAVARQCQSPA